MLSRPLLVEYTGSEIFTSGISPTKRQMAFMTTLLLYNSGTIFRTRPISNQSGDPVLRSRYAPPKSVRRTGLMGALARFLGGPGVVSPAATDSAGSVYVYAHTQESRSSALAGTMLGELALSRSRSYMACSKLALSRSYSCCNRV